MKLRFSNLQSHAAPALAVLLGAAMTLCVRGYRFGESNHAVYLVDALRRADPTLLQNDWWVQSTLQYHFAFNALTALLMRLDILEPAFLLGYLALAVLLHVVWRKLTLRLGGTDGTYLLSVILYYLLAGGVGLGMYHFLQDSAFLPSNVANVAMLWGVYFLIAGLPAPAGICLGLAGLFHINHALAGLGLWAGASLFEGRRSLTRAWMIGTVVLVLLCAAQVVPALRIVLSRTGKLPLEEFVDLFVRFRHPHHFEPRTWHWGVWLAFLAPLPPAAVAYRLAPYTVERRRAAALFVLFVATLAVALLTAGFWFVGETFVQLNLYRFSIYPKLLSCVAGAWLLWDRTPGARAALCAVFAGVACIGAGTLLTGPHGHNVYVAVLFCGLALASLVIQMNTPRTFLVGVLLAILCPLLLLPYKPFGVRLEGLTGDPPPYMRLAQWASQNTPKDAVFLVPPDEESFRPHARRAIVVNFKGVPQLSAELPEWRDRLLDVLGLKSTGDLLALPRPMGKTLAAIRARYDTLPADHHFAVARKYGARYVVLTRRLDSPPPGVSPAFDNGRYILYDLNPELGTLNRPPKP